MILKNEYAHKKIENTFDFAKTTLIKFVPKCGFQINDLTWLLIDPKLFKNTFLNIRGCIGHKLSAKTKFEFTITH